MEGTNMTYRFSNRIIGCLLAAATALALTQTVSFASRQLGQAPKSNSPSPNSNQFGELSALWWQWIYSFPADTNPNLKTGNVDCRFGQSSHTRSAQIWFLAGTFGVPTDGPIDRTCPVPRGISLFFPLLNIELDNVGCCTPSSLPFSFSIQQMKQLAAANQDNPQELHALVDGAPVPVYRAQSQVFSYSVPATHNVLQFLGLTIPGANWPSTTVFPAVSDGYWVMVDPLPPGDHVIQFGGIANTGFTVDVTYHITVTP
jgi:hypothetical protein